MNTPETDPPTPPCARDTERLTHGPWGAWTAAAQRLEKQRRAGATVAELEQQAARELAALLNDDQAGP